MKQLTCEMCGSTNLVKEGDVFVCQDCGCKYSVEAAKKMMVEGTVDVSGSTVKVDSSDEVDNWYTIARRAIESADTEKAERYYDMILGKRPDDWEANFYTVYCRTLNATYADMNNEVTNLSNSIQAIFDIIISIEEADQKNAVTEICLRIIGLCEVIDSSMYQFSIDSDSSESSVLAANAILAAASLAETTEIEMCAAVADNDELYRKDEDFKDLAIQLKRKCIDSLKTITKLRYVASTNYAEMANKKQDELKKLDPTYEKEEVHGNCYIATAVYGSYDCPEVWTLRRYRDYNLAKTWYGRTFIYTYYAISPTIVKLFGKTQWFKKMFKDKLDRMVKKLQSEGYESTPYNDKRW